jgi:hypothetical protein
MTANQSIIEAKPITTDMNISSEDIVALLVSQVDERITKQERDLNTELKAKEDATASARKAVSKFEDDLVAKKKTAPVIKSIVTNLQKLGLKASCEVDLSVDHQHKQIEFALRFTDGLNGLRNSYEKHYLDAVQIEKIPVELLKLYTTVDDLVNQVGVIRVKLLELRQYRQTEIQSLERFARGKIASEALKRAGGDHADFVNKLEALVPERLRDLLGSAALPDKTSKTSSKSKKSKK